jgi:hypothetical protein
MRSIILVASVILAFTSHAQDTLNVARGPAGLLVMAHGGSDEWNTAVENAVKPLRNSSPVAIAFGMANPETLQEAVIKLQNDDVSSISVVRLFVSGDSFLPETEYAFGLRDELPDGHFMHEPRILNVNVPVSLSRDGLLNARIIGDVLADRATNLSRDPRNEAVLIIGHGPSSDTENNRWLSRMDTMANSVRERSSFHSVRVATLREDWTGKRAVVEKELRALVQSETQLGRTVLVIPFRLHGFGPYAEVLEGLPYRADSLAFLPDPRLTKWIDAEFDSQLRKIRH